VREARFHPSARAEEQRLAAAVDWYRSRLLSQGRAAEIAGIPQADFVDVLAARRIEVAQVEVDELANELGDR
jgi:predicted HTH domain antitoxin